GTNMPELVPGVARALSPMVRRILAPNPGLMTGPGTNTYLVGVDEIAVIDPGPDDAGHLDAVAACGGDRIRRTLTTHTHPDPAPLRRLRGLRLRAIAPGHGHVIDEPKAIIEYYLRHRAEREAAIAEAVRSGARTVDEIVTGVYVDVAAELHPVARRSVHA